MVMKWKQSYQRLQFTIAVQIRMMKLLNEPVQHLNCSHQIVRIISSLTWLKLFTGGKTLRQNRNKKWQILHCSFNFDLSRNIIYSLPQNQGKKIAAKIIEDEANQNHGPFNISWCELQEACHSRPRDCCGELYFELIIVDMQHCILQENKHV